MDVSVVLMVYNQPLRVCLFRRRSPLGERASVRAAEDPARRCAALGRVAGKWRHRLRDAVRGLGERVAGWLTSQGVRR
jgi:hypothetical protein